MHDFWEKLGALTRGFTKTSVPTEKLPQLPQMKQGGEKLQSYLVSFWDLDAFHSATGKDFILVKTQDLSSLLERCLHQRFIKHS